MAILDDPMGALAVLDRAAPARTSSLFPGRKRDDPFKNYSCKDGLEFCCGDGAATSCADAIKTVCPRNRHGEVMGYCKPGPGGRWCLQCMDLDAGDFESAAQIQGA